MERIRKDAVVVGLGAWGSAALWRLAARGLDVAGVEQYQVVHNLGSTHGLTRILRIACNEHPGLVPISLKSVQLWNELSESTGETYLNQIGILNAGPPDCPLIQGALAAGGKAGIPLEVIDHDDLVARFPRHDHFGPDDIGVWDPWAGVCYPEKAVAAHLTTAKQLGAQVYPGTTVTNIEQRGSTAIVRTDTIEFGADKVVIAAGIWLTKFFPSLQLQGRRVPMYWWQPKAHSPYSLKLDEFPVFNRHLPEGVVLWGHGAGDGFGVKIGMDDHGQFDDAEADAIDRYVYEADIALMSESISAAFPDLDPRPEKVAVCIYTNSKDKLFTVGSLDTSDRIIVAGGDSGHGFKHAAGVGEAIAQLVTGEEIFTALDFLNPNRFG